MQTLIARSTNDHRPSPPCHGTTCAVTAKAALAAELNARRTAHQVDLMAGLRPVLGDFDESDVPAGHPAGPVPNNTVDDQEDSHGSGVQLSINPVRLAERRRRSPEIPLARQRGSAQSWHVLFSTMISA